MRADRFFLRPQSALLGLSLVCAIGLTGCGGESSQTLLSQAKVSLKAGDRKAAIIGLHDVPSLVVTVGAKYSDEFVSFQILLRSTRSHHPQERKQKE